MNWLLPLYVEGGVLGVECSPFSCSSVYSTPSSFYSGAHTNIPSPQHTNCVVAINSKPHIHKPNKGYTLQLLCISNETWRSTLIMPENLLHFNLLRISVSYSWNNVGDVIFWIVFGPGDSCLSPYNAHWEFSCLLVQTCPMSKLRALQPP